MMKITVQCFNQNNCCGRHINNEGILKKKIMKIIGAGTEPKRIGFGTQEPLKY
jgi:hypothetical protein